MLLVSSFFADWKLGSPTYDATAKETWFWVALICHYSTDDMSSISVATVNESVSNSVMDISRLSTFNNSRQACVFYWSCLCVFARASVCMKQHRRNCSSEFQLPLSLTIQPKTGQLDCNNLILLNAEELRVARATVPLYEKKMRFSA